MAEVAIILANEHVILNHPIPISFFCVISHLAWIYSLTTEARAMRRKTPRVVYSPIPPVAVVDAVRLLRICVALAVVFAATPVVVTF